MAFEAKVYYVMIASPGDVSEERKQIIDLLMEWNRENSERFQIVLLPLRWEEDSAPYMGRTPQETINKQMCDKSDLLIALFKTKLGTPIDGYESGTAEEIEYHREQGKPVMLYFYDGTLPGDVDLEEVQRLRDYKGKIWNTQKALTGTFKDTESLMVVLRRNISTLVQNEMPFIQEVLIDEKNEEKEFFEIEQLSTDDEKAVLYYIIKTGKRKVDKAEIENWLRDEEIFGIDVDNGFDLLATLGSTYIIEEHLLELNVNVFRKCYSQKEKILLELEVALHGHINKASERLVKLLNENNLTTEQILLLAYVYERKAIKLGDRWIAEQHQIPDIQKWEKENNLDDDLSKSYLSCLNYFVEKKFLYESDWTSYGNPREYTWYPSVTKWFLRAEATFVDAINCVKVAHFTF